MKLDLSGPVRAALDTALGNARTQESSGNNAEAANAYIKAAGLMENYAAYALTRADQERRREKSIHYLDYARALRNENRRPITSRPMISQPPPRAEVAAPECETSGSLPQEIAALIHRSKITWDQIGGLEPTKREIKFTYGLALAQKPDSIKFAGWKRMLFYGPPGTGKTLLAAATSNGLGATFFNVKVSNLLSKYFGESSKLITALFDAARDEADAGFSVVFIDEIESLVMARGDSSDNGAERKVLSTILSELDGLADKGEDRYVLTIAATNAPWDLDDAVLSRFQKRIYIPLPDAGARRAIAEILLLRTGHQLEYPLEAVVERSQFFSGRDLERLANQAVNIMVEEMNIDIPKLVDRGRDEIQNYRLRTRPLTKRDFDIAFDRIRVDVERYKQLELRYRAFAESN